MILTAKILYPLNEIMSLTQHQQLYETIQKSANPLITFGKNWSGDALAASLAMANFLKKIGKTAEIVSPNFSLPYAYKFLAEAEKIKSHAGHLKNIVISIDVKNNQHPQLDYRAEEGKLHIHLLSNANQLSKSDITVNDSTYKHDLIITLNTPDLESFEELFHENTDFFYQVPIINIDHTPENEHYGQINFINLTASSVSEIIYDFLDKADANLLDETIATYLLTGMIEKTKSFKIPTVTPKSLNVASRLMAAGAERGAIIQNLYQRQTVGALKLWGRVLMSLKTDDLQKVAWAEITENDFLETRALPLDLTGVIDELIVSIPSVELTALFYDKDNRKTCLLKSEKNLDLTSEFRDYKPIGNKNLIKIELANGIEPILTRLKTLT